MQIWDVSLQNKHEIAKNAAAFLKKGKVLVFPTDTVYGLVADATNRKAVQKIFQIKGRKQGKPLPIFVNSITMAKTLAKVSSLQEKYMRKVWPGKVTLVLESKGVLPKETGTAKSIGLRIPKHELLQAILKKARRPLTGTSANLAGNPPFSDGKAVLKEFQEKKYAPDILIDAGRLSRSYPSKVIDITETTPKVLRK
tara:strand:+ start:6270 stop:6860 length:591 start_codon:yes stop_codon:yes gene_type:complete